MWQEEQNMEEMKDRALLICREFLSGSWGELELENFSFSKISGGFSNRLYLCSFGEDFQPNDSKIPNEVLLRVYGPFRERENERYMDHILEDVVIFTVLAEKGLGPKLYGVFSDGRLEEYVPSETLDIDSIRRLSPLIAKEMARIHAQQLPIRKDPDVLIHSTAKWLDDLEKYLAENKDAEQILSSGTLELIANKKLRQELEWLSDLIHKADSPVVFCHNDLIAGNILQRRHLTDEDKRSEIMFIDFEFACYNYRTFDIADHFVEWSFDYEAENDQHFEYFPEKYPSEAEQSTFIDIYLKTLKNEGQLIDRSLEEEKQKILKQLPVFEMFSHFLWAVCCLRRTLDQITEFPLDYKKLAECRLDIYRTMKKEWTEKNSKSAV